MPQLVAAPQQRNVRRVLVVGEADDPGQPVRRATLVPLGELLQAEDAVIASGEMVGSGTPHPAQADDDGVITVWHSQSGLRS